MSDDRFRDAVSKNLRGEISADDYFDALRDDLAERREQKLHDGVGYEWSAVQAYAHEFAAEQIREFIADLACEFGGHIPDMTNVNLGAILARLDRLASTLEAEL